jgi:hypothetical protein
MAQWGRLEGSGIELYVFSGRDESNTSGGLAVNASPVFVVNVQPQASHSN